jgi:predicted dehydrogenase
MLILKICPYIAPVKVFAGLERDETSSFLDGHRFVPIRPKPRESAMHDHRPSTVLFLQDGRIETLRSLLAFLTKIPHLRLDTRPRLPADLSSWNAVVTAVAAVGDADLNRLADFVQAGGGWLHLIGPDSGPPPRLLGVQAEPAGPRAELRVLFANRDDPLGMRLPEAFYVQEHFHPLALEAGDAEMILYADWQYQRRAVLVQRRLGDGAAACTTLQNFDHPVSSRICYRLIRRLSGCPPDGRSLGVGILGYAPSVGRFHGQGVTQTAGLALKSACDQTPERLDQAQGDFPQIRTFASAEALGNDPDVELVIIATPPNTHARLALQMLAAGKHVVCEKPLALNRAETASMAEAAHRQGLHLSCHQNRRWDVDYLAIRQTLAEGLIGDLFYMETFVGGFAHPCGYWHSHAAVSGGTAYDWGGHYIDWMVSLCGGPIAAVIGTGHKRVWHDVTNADQERIQIRFADGREAEFMHSDIAAARKPKWYLLGTRGAIVGRWQDISAYGTDPLHYYERRDIPATEMPPDLTVYRRHGSRKITTLKPAVPDRPKFGFHRNLADHLLTGEPLDAPLEDSMRVVAILEAAARSMEHGGRVEVLDV